MTRHSSDVDSASDETETGVHNGMLTDMSNPQTDKACKAMRDGEMETDAAVTPNQDSDETERVMREFSLIDMTDMRPTEAGDCEEDCSQIKQEFLRNQKK